MAGNTEIVEISDRLLAPDELLTQQDLASEAQILRGGGRRRIREGGITIGRPRMTPLLLDDFPDFVRRRPDARRRRFVLLHLPFDLDELYGSRRYRQARFRITLNMPDAISHSQWPMLVTTQTEVERSSTFGVQTDLSFGAIPGAPSVELAREMVYRYTALHPIITAFGIGQPRFSWLFMAQPEADLPPGHRSVFAILDVPGNVPAVIGAFDSEAVVGKQQMGLFETVDAVSRTIPFRIRLDTGETTLLESA